VNHAGRIVTPSALTIARPQPDEYAPYYDRYISLVAGNDILTTLDEQRRQTLLVLSGRSEADGDFHYAPGKWSAKEVLATCATPSASSPIVPADRARRPRPDGRFQQDDYVRDGPFAIASSPT